MTEEEEPNSALALLEAELDRKDKSTGLTRRHLLVRTIVDAALGRRCKEDLVGKRRQVGPAVGHAGCGGAGHRDLRDIHGSEHASFDVVGARDLIRGGHDGQRPRVPS